jgi:hypothetical protein
MTLRRAAAIVRGMTDSDGNPSNDTGELGVGDVVRLREPHGVIEAGTRGRVIGFYGTEPREALLALEEGQQLRVPLLKLERAR